MGGIGGMELLVVGLVALIVVGPKDLPGMFRTVGQFTGKAKRMAREFSSAMEAAADEAGVNDVAKTIKAATDPKKMGLDAVKKAVDPTKFADGSATQELAKERAETTKKIKSAMNEAAVTRRTKEEAAAAEAATKPATTTKAKAVAKAKSPAKSKTKAATAAAKTKANAKSAAKSKAAAKPKPAAKTASKTAAKTSASRKPAAKKASS